MQKKKGNQAVNYQKEAMTISCFSLLGLDKRHNLGSKYPIPEAAGYTKAILVVEEVVLKVVFLQVLVPQRQILVVQEVVGEVVADIAKDTTAENGRADVPVVPKEEVCKLPEWERQDEEQGWRHHKTKLVHREVVVNAMKKEVEGNCKAIVWKVPINKASIC